MLTLLVNNQRVDLLPDTSVSLSMANPLFDSDFIPVAHSLGIDLPATHTNCAIFAHPHRLTSEEVLLSERKFKLYYDGLVLFEGVVSLNEWTRTIINVQLLGSTVIDQLKTKLYQLPLPVVEFGEAEEFFDRRLDEALIRPTHSALSNYYAYWQQQAAVSNPIYLPAPISVEGVNQTLGSSVINLKRRSENNDYSAYTGAVLPAMQVGYLFAQIIPNASDVFNTPKLRNLMLITNYHPKYRGTDNGISGRNFIDYQCIDINIDDMSVTFNPADCLPDIECVDFVKELLKMLCASLYIVRGVAYIDFNKTILNSLDHKDWTALIESEVTTSVIPPQSYKFSFSNAQDRDDISADEVAVEYTSAVDMVEAESLDCELQRTLDTGQVFEVAIDNSLNTNNIEYKLLQDSLMSFGDDDADIKIETAINVAKCVVRIDPDSGSQGNDGSDGRPTSEPSTYSYYVCPEVSAATPGKRPTTLTIAQYVGFTTSPLSDEVSYPQLNAVGDATRLSLVNGDLYNNYHKDMADWYASPRRQVKVKAKLGIADLVDLDFRIKIYYAGRYYFIESLDVSLTHNSIGLADVVLTEINL